MLSVSEATDLIRDSVKPLPAEACALAESLHRVLAADVLSGTDSPPFDKALMDGFAVRAEDCAEAGTQLRIVGEVTAGNVATVKVESGQAIRIMTGAPLPAGADAVVPFERTSSTDEQVTVNQSVTRDACVLRQGAAMQRGDCVLSAGKRLRPQELGLLAELGVHTVTVAQRPRVAILATGDELVPVHEQPGPGQIRNSNESMLAAQIENASATAVPLGIARDDAEHLELGISLGLQADILVLSGGVSAGKLDLVPSVLAAAGVEEVFHKVRVKPGKPVWFGMGRQDDRTVPVFGLPGNPVSSMVCFELFVREALNVMTGAGATREVLRLPTAEAVAPNADRPTYHPAALVDADTGPAVRFVDWVGSADLRCTVDATGMALLPAAEAELPAGTVVEFTAWGPP